MAQTIATGVAIFFMANFLEHCSWRVPGPEVVVEALARKDTV
jgi:hypothetical protein